MRTWEHARTRDGDDRNPSPRSATACDGGARCWHLCVGYGGERGSHQTMTRLQGHAARLNRLAQESGPHQSGAQVVTGSRKFHGQFLPGCFRIPRMSSLALALVWFTVKGRDPTGGPHQAATRSTDEPRECDGDAVCYQRQRKFQGSGERRRRTRGSVQGERWI